MNNISHCDLVFQRKCRQLYLYDLQNHNNILEYRTGKVNNDFLNSKKINFDSMSENTNITYNKYRLPQYNNTHNDNNGSNHNFSIAFNEYNQNLKYQFSKNSENYSDESTQKAFNEYNISNKINKNIKNIINYSNDETKTTFYEAKKYWINKEKI